MKKHFLFLATLVLGFGQLFADQVTFSIADLRATLPSNNTKVEVPYTWKVSPYHVSVTIAKKDGTTGTLSIATPTTLTNYTLKVTIAGEGSLDGVTVSAPTGVDVLGASNGSYESGTWAPTESGIKSVTFTPTGNFRLSSLTVDYTPDSGYTPDVPAGGFTEPFEATPVDNKASYTGNDPYIYDKASLKFYALNSNGEYEEYGIASEVNTLKVAGASVQEIEYIATNSTMGVKPYINTGYVHKANTRIVMECNIDGSNTANYQAPFGSRAGYGSNMYAFFWRFEGNNRGCFARNNEKRGTDGVNVPTGEKIKIDANGVSLNVYKDGETEPCVSITDDGEPKAGTTPMYLFDLCHVDHADGSATFMKLYSTKIYEGETLVMDLVPAVNGEGKGGLKDKLTDTFYGSPNNGEFELSADGQAMAGEAGIPVYEGKIVIYNNHEYEYYNGSFVDRGEMAYVSVPEIGTDYKNISNWTYPDKGKEGGSAYDGTFGVNVFDGTTNTLNPYQGAGNWEPLSYKLTNLTKGETYRASFIYSGNAWYSWSSYTTLPFFVLDNENMPDNTFNNPGAALGYIALPNTDVSNQAYSTVFTVNHNYALLCIQFGVVDDGAHGNGEGGNDKAKNWPNPFAFSFGNINIEKRVLPQAYNKIDWADPVKYTELEYIEAISQALNNPFTLPYKPVTTTQIDTKFQVYDTSTGWCGIFCARNEYAGTGISLYMNGNDRAHFGYFTGNTAGAGDNFAPFSLNTDYEVQADVTKLVVNGTEYPTGNTVTNATRNKLSLFANPEHDNPMRGRFYYCNISEAGETLYNFKPVMRHDGAFGFYDKASRIFVMPAQGTLDGYSYKKFDDQAYVTYNTETRIVMVGSTAQFLPDVQNLDGATFTWTSSDETKATVAADGTVTGLSAGKVIITATTDADNGWTASYELIVSEPEYKRYDANQVGYAIVTGGNGWGDSPLSALLDNDARTKFGCSGSGDAWAIIIASEPVAVQQYSFVTGGDTYKYPSRNPRSWKLEGSNDNQNWTVIDEHSDFDAYKIHAVNKEEFEFPVNGTETYKFFKFSAGVVDGFQLGEFWINAQAHNYAEAPEQNVAATCTKEGKVVYECEDCHALFVKPIPVEDHTYADGICTACGIGTNDVLFLANGQTNPYAIKFRHKPGSNNNVEIEEGWSTPDFDDSAWDELIMPIGTNGYDKGARDGAIYNTIWFNEYNTYWFRRTFEVANPEKINTVTLKILHDDCCEVRVNGTIVRENPEGDDWTGGLNWLEIEVDPELLVVGKNVVAVYIEQNWGGAYCDFSLEGTIKEEGTAIKGIEFNVDNEVIYNIAGQRLQKAQKGVNIINGKKVMK